jgi:hypothetical protein
MGEMGMRNHSCETCLRPLTPYEPNKRAATRRTPASTAPLAPDDGSGQLALDLVLRTRVNHECQKPPNGDSAPDQRYLGRVITTVLEATEGRRPAVQVRPLLEPRLYARLFATARTSSGARYTLRSVHARQPTDSALETCATVHSGRQAFAIAARFEKTRSGWRCTRFEVLKPPALRQRRRAA